MDNEEKMVKEKRNQEEFEEKLAKEEKILEEIRDSLKGSLHEYPMRPSTT